MIKRHTNAIVNQQDLNQIKEMIDSYNSNRYWQFQRSKSESTTSFFISYLNDYEIKLLYRNLFSFVERYDDNSKLKLDRAYINCYPAYTGGDWHTDGDAGITVLYYPNTDLNFDSEGGTEFEHHGVEKYIKNSIIIFPANHSHRALEHTMQGKYRFSIAVKLKYN